MQIIRMVLSSDSSKFKKVQVFKSAKLSLTSWSARWMHRARAESCRYVTRVACCAKSELTKFSGFQSARHCWRSAKKHCLQYWVGVLEIWQYSQQRVWDRVLMLCKWEKLCWRWRTYRRYYPAYSRLSVETSWNNFDVLEYSLVCMVVSVFKIHY